MKALLLALTLTLGAGHASHAQTFPVRPIRIIVANPAGTGQDVEARQLVPQISAELGVPVVVENRPGGGGLIGIGIVAKATADGYTLGAGIIGNLALHPRLFDRPYYDVDRDLTGVSLYIKHPWVLYVHASVPAQSFQQFLSLAKAKPESMTYASGGIGSVGHVSFALFQDLAGVRLRHVPYGAQPWQPALLGGHVDAAMSVLIGLVDHARSGKLRALAISNGKERSPQLPNVPMFSEVGLPTFDMSAWAGLIAPAATPKPIIEKLANAATRAAQTAQFRAFTAESGATPIGSTPQEFDAFIKSERTRWRKVIADNAIKLD